MTATITQADRDCLRTMMQCPENCDVSGWALSVIATYREKAVEQFKNELLARIQGPTVINRQQ